MTPTNEIKTVVDSAIKICGGVMPNNGVKVLGNSLSSYQGHLCRWDEGVRPVALCKMKHFEERARELLREENPNE